MGLQPDEVEESVVAKPLDGSSRISFIDELDTLEVSKSELGQIDNGDNGNNSHDEEADQIQGDAFEHTDGWMDARSQRDASYDVMLTEDEVDRIFDDVFATPEDKGRQVTMNEIALTRALTRHGLSGDMLSIGKSRNSPWIKYQREILVCLILALIALLAWSVGRVQSNMDSDNDDITGEPTHMVAIVTPDHDPAIDDLLAHTLNGTAANPQWSNPIDATMQDIIHGNDNKSSSSEGSVPTPLVDATIEGIIRGRNETSSFEGTGPPPLRTKEFIWEPNAAPGKDIGEFLVGFVKQPIDAAALRLLLKHDLTNPLMVNCEDATLDTSEAILVTVDNYELKCGINIDNIPLTAICVPNDLCGIYTVDASYCDKYE